MEISKKEIQLLAQIIKNEFKKTTKIIKECDPDTSTYDQRTTDLFSSLEEIKTESPKIAVKISATATQTETGIAAGGKNGTDISHGEDEVRTTKVKIQVPPKNRNSSSKTRKAKIFFHGTGKQAESTNLITKIQDPRRFRRPKQITGPGPPINAINKWIYDSY